MKGEKEKAPQVYCAHSEIVPLRNLKPHPQNPNKHPKEQVELLAKIIDAHGWRQPITVSNRSGYVVRGHGRLEAAALLFLSRLCGGQVTEEMQVSSMTFLSRLCGGQANRLLFGFSALFLSRLCGGQVAVFRSM